MYLYIIILIRDKISEYLGIGESVFVCWCGTWVTFTDKLSVMMSCQEYSPFIEE